MKKFSLIKPIEGSIIESSIEERVVREHRPFQLQLSEISQDELIYLEHIDNPYLDKRTLGQNVYTYRKYVFHKQSIFMNYMFLNQRTRMLFLFRRLSGCQHKHSCLESILRKVYEVFSFYSMLRLPIHFLLSKLSQTPDSNIMDTKAFLASEILILLTMGCLSSAGCYVRFMQEEII